MKTGRLEYALALAWRGMRRHPRSSVLIVVVMAFGLAACMTMLTVFHTLAADPLHGRGKNVETVLVSSKGSTIAASDAPLKADVAQRVVTQAGSMPVMAMVLSNDAVQTTAAAGPNEPDPSIIAATSKVGDVFGIPLQSGRWWSARDDLQHTPVAVIGPRLAEHLFGTQAVLGKTIQIDGKVLRIIGVSGDWSPTLQFFAQGATVYGRVEAEVFIPLSVAQDAKLGVSAVGRCTGNFMAKPWTLCGQTQLWAWGLNASQRNQLKALVWHNLSPEAQAKLTRPQIRNLPVLLDMQHVLPDNLRAYVWVAVAFLALCLFNAAGVLAARFMRRGSEVGIRRALGASRRDVFVQHLCESGCLAIAGGVLALPLVFGALVLLHAQAVSYHDLVHFSVGTFAGLCVVTLVTGLLVGLFPAWRASARAPALQIKQN